MKDCVINDAENSTSSSSNSTSNTRLMSLTITECSLSKEHIELLLSETRLLRHFKLISQRGTLDSVFDGLDWEQFIQNKLSTLEKFEFFLSHRNQWYDFIVGLDSLIDSYRSPFWLKEKHWLVAAAYIIKSSQIWLYTRPFSGMDHDMSQVRYELSSTDYDYRLVARPIDIIFDTDSNV
ncbi:unnamed protein product, partial [Rotaria sp. Silwood2]